jgi:hypothetical protein
MYGQIFQVKLEGFSEAQNVIRYPKPKTLIRAFGLNTWV